MNKLFKSVSALFAFVLAIGSLALTTSCKGTEKKSSDSTEEIETASEMLAELDALGNVFDDAIKSCGVSEEDVDEEMELVDFETVTDDEDGTEIPVAYFRYKGEIFQMMDIDADGTFDIAVFDSDDDGDITDDEIVDITEQNITLDDIAEMAGAESSCEDGDECYAECDDDEEESIVERTSREARTPSHQLREEAEEEDLPDYVNNARVKALRKK